MDEPKNASKEEQVQVRNRRGQSPMGITWAEMDAGNKVSEMN